MTFKTQLKFSSIGFAVVWVSALCWFARPIDMMPLVILIIAGGFSGLAWYALFGRLLRWQAFRIRR